MTLPLHISVWSCLNTTFFTGSRLGEFTLRTLKSFKPNLHVKALDVSEETDRNGLKTRSYKLPSTKVAMVHGETVSCARQDGECDPEDAFHVHLCVNNPAIDGPLFAYHDGKKHKALTKTMFLKVLKSAALAAGLDVLQGHGIRIGSTLEYLLRGIPFDVVKVIGRWSGDSFKLYLCKHAVILAPYLQANPAVKAEFIRIAMPPVH